jgi:hypothetical protein
MRRNSVSFVVKALIGAAALFYSVTGFAVQDDAPGASPQFSHPDRIRYDSHSIIIDGKPVFIYSGAIHYFRCPRELWKDRLQKLKDAGQNCVETYIDWNLHEPQEPTNPNDFSKLREMEQIGDFIQTARDLGLYVIVRPGPYICAEVDRGGLPGWLLKYRPDGAPHGQFLRGNSPVMLAWDRHWLTAVAKVVKPHLITNLPKGSTGVILWQLENEYDWNFAGFSSEVRTDVLRALARASLDNGINVPLLTCETMDNAFRADPLLRAHLVNTTNKYPGYDMKQLTVAIEKVAQYQPEAFRGVTELQGGWFSEVGGKLAEDNGLNGAQITQLTLAAIEHGCTSINYYMFYGGSNFGCTASPPVAQSYDYNAPLREWGARGERYFAVAAIGQMLKEYGEQLIHSDPVEISVEGDHPNVSVFLRQSQDGSRFFFLRNAKQNAARSGTVTVRITAELTQAIKYQLGNFEAKVLYVPPGATSETNGQWLPKPVAHTATTHTTLAAVPVRTVSIVSEDAADHWRDVPSGGHLESADIFEQRYVHYRLTFDLSAADMQSQQALFVRSDGGGDTLTARINGVEVSPTKDGIIPLTSVAHAGSNIAEILFENLGCQRFGPVIEDLQGITQVRLAPQASLVQHATKHENDALGRSLGALQVSPDTIIASEPMSADRRRRMLTHYTLEFQLPSDASASSAAWKLHLEANVNAFVTLNGHSLGRYWAIGPQRDIWLPECWLKFGPDAKNMIELQARPTADAPVGKIITRAEVQEYDQ